MTPLLLSILLAAPNSTLPTWTQRVWSRDGVARTVCLDDGTLVAERHGRLIGFTPDGTEHRYDALGHVGELRRSTGGFWLQRRGTTDSAAGQRLDRALSPVGAEFTVSEPAFFMRPCGPDAVIGQARRAPLKVYRRGGVALEIPAPNPWAGFGCDDSGQTAYSDDAGTITARAVETGTERWRYAPGTHADLGPTRAMAVHGDGLVVVLGNGRLAILDRASGAVRAFSPLAEDGRGETPIERSDGWWLGEQRFGSTLDAHGRAANRRVCPLPDGRLRQWTDSGLVVDGPLESSMRAAAGIGHAITPSGIAIDPKSGAIYTIDAHRVVIGWGKDGVRWVSRGLARTLDRARDLALAPDGRHVYALGRGTLRQIATADGETVRRWALDSARSASRLRLSADGRRAAFGHGADGIGLIDLPGGTIRVVAVGVTESGHGPAFDLSPDGEVLAVADPDKPLRLFDAATGTVRPGPARPASRAVAFHPTGTRMALALTRGGLAVHDTETATQLAAAPDLNAQHLAFDSSGRWLAWGGWSHDLGAWCWHADCPATQRAPRSIDPPWHVSAVAFGPDGTLWSTGADQAITGWDRTTGARRRVLRAGRASRTHESAVVFSPESVFFGLPDGSLLRIPISDGAPTRMPPGRPVIEEGITRPPAAVSAIRLRPDGTIEAADEGAVIQRWVDGVAGRTAALKTESSPEQIAPFGDGWAYGSWEGVRAFDGRGRPSPIAGALVGSVQRIIGGGDRLLVETEADSRRQVQLMKVGQRASRPLTADAFGPAWLTPDGAAVLHRSWDPATADEEGEDVEPAWRLARFAAGRWTDDDEADVETLPTLREELAARLSDGRVVVGTVNGVAVIDGATGRWLTGFWLGPRGARVVRLAAHPTRAMVAVGDGDGGVHVFDVDAGRRIVHGFGYADGDWFVRRADGRTHAPKSGRHR